MRADVTSTGGTVRPATRSSGRLAIAGGAGSCSPWWLASPPAARRSSRRSRRRRNVGAGDGPGTRGRCAAGRDRDRGSPGRRRHRTRLGARRRRRRDVASGLPRPLRVLQRRSPDRSRPCGHVCGPRPAPRRRWARRGDARRMAYLRRRRRLVRNRLAVLVVASATIGALALLVDVLVSRRQRGVDQRRPSAAGVVVVRRAGRRRPARRARGRLARSPVGLLAGSSVAAAGVWATTSASRSVLPRTRPTPGWMSRPQPAAAADRGIRQLARRARTRRCMISGIA